MASAGSCLLVLFLVGTHFAGFGFFHQAKGLGRHHPFTDGGIPFHGNLDFDSAGNFPVCVGDLQLKVSYFFSHFEVFLFCLIYLA
jgi:hypothetical protein